MPHPIIDIVQDEKLSDGDKIARIQAELASNPLASLEEKSPSGASVLHGACKNGRPELLRWLLKEKRELIYARDKQEANVLFYAAGYGNEAAVKIFVNEYKIDVNAVNAFGKTPLHVATQQGQLSSVAFLLEQKADVNIATKAGDTVMHFAALAPTNQLPLIKLLEANGAKRDGWNSKGASPLHVASEQGKVEVVTHFLTTEPKVNVNQVHQETEQNKGLRGQTSLHRAARKGHLKVLEVLIHHGAKREVFDDRGICPFHQVVMYGHRDAVEYFLNVAKTDVDLAAPESKTHEDWKGSTALHWAALFRQSEVLKILLQHCADTSRKNSAGRFPVDELFLEHEEDKAPLERRVSCLIQFFHVSLFGKKKFWDFFKTLPPTLAFQLLQKILLEDNPQKILEGVPEQERLRYFLEVIKTKLGLKNNFAKFFGVTEAEVLAVISEQYILMEGNTTPLLKEGTNDKPDEKAVADEKNSKPEIMFLDIFDKGEPYPRQFTVSEWVSEVSKKLFSAPVFLAKKEEIVSILNAIKHHNFVYAISLLIQCDVRSDLLAAHDFLRVACLNGIEELVDYLLPIEKIDFESERDRASSLLRYATYGKVSIVRQLIHLGAPYDNANDKGRLSMHIAAEIGNVEVLEYYLDEQKLDIYTPTHDEFGDTCVHLAAFFGNLKILKALEKRKIDLDCRNKQGFTPLMYAARKGIIHTQDKTHALVYLLTKNRTDVATYVYQIQGDTQGRWSSCEDGKNLAHTLSGSGYYKTLKALHKLGLLKDVNKPNKVGVYPVHSAIVNGHPTVVDFWVLDYGVDANFAHPTNANTLLHYAVGWKKENVVEHLLSLRKGSQASNLVFPGARNKEGLLPLEVVFKKLRSSQLREFLPKIIKIFRLLYHPSLFNSPIFRHLLTTSMKVMFSEELKQQFVDLIQFILSGDSDPKLTLAVLMDWMKEQVAAMPLAGSQQESKEAFPESHFGKSEEELFSLAQQVEKSIPRFPKILAIESTLREIMPYSTVMKNLTHFLGSRLDKYLIENIFSCFGPKDLMYSVLMILVASSQVSFDAYQETSKQNKPRRLLGLEAAGDSKREDVNPEQKFSPAPCVLIDSSGVVTKLPSGPKDQEPASASPPFIIVSDSASVRSSKAYTSAPGDSKENKTAPGGGTAGSSDAAPADSKATSTMQPEVIYRLAFFQRLARLPKVRSAAPASNDSETEASHKTVVQVKPKDVEQKDSVPPIDAAAPPVLVARSAALSL